MYNLPENQLLKFILTEIENLSQEKKFIQQILQEELNKDNQGYWQNQINKRVISVKNALKHVYMQDIKVPKRINSKTVIRTYNHRNKHYESVAKCYKLYQKIFLDNNRKVLTNLIQTQQLKPSKPEKMYELFVLFKILDSFDDKTLKIRLIKPKNYDDYNFVSSVKENNKSIYIYYQRLTMEFDEESKYKDIFKYYDLKKSLRRPDIMIMVESPTEKPEYYLVEIKLTKDDHYIADSIYKTLGYISDFEKILLNEPKALLIVWDNIKEIKSDDLPETLQNPIVMLNHNNLDLIKELILKQA